MPRDRKLPGEPTGPGGISGEPLGGKKPEGRRWKISEGKFAEFRIDARFKEMIAASFLYGRYDASTNALLELTDNSVGWRNRDSQHATEIRVDFEWDRKKIRVTDYGGLGANADGINFFFNLGKTKGLGIGHRGGVAKAAAFYFGNDIEIQAKKAGEATDFSTGEIEGMGDRTKEFKGKHSIYEAPSLWDTDKGRFEVTIRNLRNKEQLHMPSRGVLKRYLGEVYRPLLAKTQDGHKPGELLELPYRTIVDAKGKFHQVRDRVRMFVGVKRESEEVEPLPIPLLPQYSEDNIQIAETPQGEKMWYWAGEMDLINNDAKKLEKKGIRFYYDGRLIMIDYCGFESSDYRLSGLIGEVHVDHIKGIKEQLPVNKAAGLNPKSELGQRIRGTMHEALKPLIEQMKDKQYSEIRDIPPFIDEVMREIFNTGDGSVKDLAKAGLVDPDIVESFYEGLKWQKPPQRLPSNPEEEKEKKIGERRGKPWNEQHGKTIPDDEIDKRFSRVRRSFFDHREYKTRTDQKQKASFVEIREIDGKRERILIINTASPTVQIAFKEGKFASLRLFAEEYREHVASEYTSSLPDYQEFKELLRFQMDTRLLAKPEYQRISGEEQEIPQNQEEIE